MSRKITVVTALGERQREIVFRIRTTTPFLKLKQTFAEKVALPLNILQFKIGGLEIKDEDTTEKLNLKDYDKVFVSMKPTKAYAYNKSEIDQYEEQLKKLKETTRENLIKDIEMKKDNLESYTLNKELETKPIEDAIRSMQISLENLNASLTQLKNLHLKEIRKKEDAILLAEEELEEFDKSLHHGRLSGRKDFECPVCYQLMEPPRRIFQCKSGHILCEKCRSRPEVKTCPTCRVFLGPRREFLSRNLAMEKLAGVYLGV